MSPDEDPPASGSNGGEDDEGRTVVRIPRRRRETDGHEPELHETIQGARPGDRTIRLTRAGEAKLRRVGEGSFEATIVAQRARTRLGRAWTSLRHILIGEPLASSALHHERLSKLKALAVFSSDNLSSSAYATEEMLLVLILAGTVAFSYALPIALTIALLVAIVAVSYIQLVRAYPRGGGAYDVTRVNIGRTASLLAGSTLCVDFILTVAVSTAAGVAAITSAIPELHDLKIELAVGFVALLTIGNLRGIRESGTIFAIPPYFFILTFGGMIVVGLTRLALGHEMHVIPPEETVEEGAAAVTLFLLLRAFSSGAAALTGIEALAEGTPSFKPPEARNAAVTLASMATILAAFFIGTTILATELDVVPSEQKTVVAQIASAVFGENVFFYMVQVGTALILVLAANTAFAGLPTLASVMARDRVMPAQFAYRGERLAFSNGILVLGITASIVLILFQAETHSLIPLYAFGVFLAFTLSQSGMVIHWRRNRERGWRLYLAINAVGAVVTGVVAVIVGATKFADGAWLSMLAMAILFVVLWLIQAHYVDAEEQLDAGMSSPGGVAEHFYGVSAGRPQTVIVLVDQLNRAVLRTVAYARTLSPNAVAVHVTDDREAADAFRKQWETSVPDVPLTILESPYRSLVEPLMAYIESMDRTQPNHMVTVVLPEFVVKRFWHRILHNQLAVRMKNELIKRPNTVIVEVPYHFER
ncbi:MAG TPA: APC family permease [Dehalococcoidia bacterium]|nr:APC family permease [Dehalococcoidia bacterium]